MLIEGYRFEWDEEKNVSNQRKHRLSFEEATHVFLDPLNVSVQDRIVNGEERWQTFGQVGGALLILVAHTVRDQGSEAVIRIISARAATRQERRRYEEENR